MENLANKATMTRESFIKKWISHIRYETRDERDELEEEMDQDLDQIFPGRHLALKSN